MINSKITKTFAEILGLLCAEGCHVISYSSYNELARGKIYYRKNKKSERIEFYNKDKALILHYQTLLLQEFNHKSRVTKHGKVNIAKRKLIRKIIDKTELGHLKWMVPELIINGTRSVKIHFIRGFFDGDGTSSSSVRMFSTNYEGIIQISKLLDDLRYKFTLNGPIIKPGRKPAYVLRISNKDKERFLKEIDPISKRSGCGDRLLV